MPQTQTFSFAYPFGKLSNVVKKAVREAGFALGVSADTGGLPIEDNPMQVFRINTLCNEGAGSLFKKTSFWYRKHCR